MWVLSDLPSGLLCSRFLFGDRGPFVTPVCPGAALALPPLCAQKSGRIGTGRRPSRLRPLRVHLSSQVGGAPVRDVAVWQGNIDACRLGGMLRGDLLGKYGRGTVRLHFMAER